MGRIEDVIDRLYEPLVKQLRSFPRSEDDARDLAQAAFVRMWKHLDSVRSGGEWAYLKVTAQHLANNQHRGQHTKKRGGDEPPIDHTVPPPRSAETELIAEEERARFRQAFGAVMAELPEESRLIIELRRRGFDNDAIADKLKMSSTAVRSRLSRAFAIFRERLAGIPHELHWLETDGEDVNDRKG